MSEVEKLLAEIKFAVDMYSAGAEAADNALERIFKLVDGYEEEVAE